MSLGTFAAFFDFFLNNFFFKYKICYIISKVFRKDVGGKNASKLIPLITCLFLCVPIKSKVQALVR